MARTARKRSATGIYHVILRGINKQIIFEDENDFRTFISVLQHYKTETGFQMYAYCLMHNHIHLLVRETEDDISEIMKKIEVTFVKWYNQKYQRIGNLFQERYKSEPIETEEYLLAVFRYIHQNPLHAGLETKVGETYPWSSYAEYRGGIAVMTNIDIMATYFENQDMMISFLNQSSHDACMEHYTPRSLSDEEAIREIDELTGCASPSDFEHLDLESRNRALQRLIFVGFSLRQLNRLTGISINKLRKIMNQ